MIAQGRANVWGGNGYFTRLATTVGVLGAGLLGPFSALLVGPLLPGAF